jgi:hypothetical protein
VSKPPGSRILTVVRQAATGSCDGAAVDLSDRAAYSLATIDFVVAGGDSYPISAAAPSIREPMVDVVATYLSSRAVVSSSLNGRICAVTETDACANHPATPVQPSITPPQTGDAGLR